MSTKQLSGHCRSIVLTVVFLMLFCSIAAVAADCPSGCSCLLPADAKAKGYDPCSGQLSVCGYDRYQNTMYCYKSGLSLTLRTLQPISIATTTPEGTCPTGCSCMLESDAKEKFGAYSRCSDTPCYTITTGSAQLKAYCFRQGTTTTTPAPTCPQGCSCISDATATAKGGSWSRCSENICGYEQSTATLAAVVQVPKYCQKQAGTTPVCPEGCVCITDAMAKERYGDYTRCSENTCGYEQSTATLAAVVQVPKYCVKAGSTTPVCPDGCACISEEDARLKGFFDRCDSGQTPCGYRTADAATTSAAQRIPLYCYKIPTTTPAPLVCPQGCYCLQEADAKLKFGPNNYTRCQADICGYDPSATTANGIPKYCFKPAITPTPRVCPAGCNCTTDEIAKKFGATPCNGERTSCGYDADKQPLYCFNWSSASTCVYDYQKNACSGTCQQGYTCSLLASKKDAAGTVVYGACGCTGQPVTPCAYDAQKNACTGTCQGGAACSVVGKNVDEKTGAATPVCGCPQQNACSYNYDKEACVGTCTATGDLCQLNTIYRDPATGKVAYAECHCKGSGAQTCAYNAENYCAGTCPQGGQCANTSVVDASGKMTFVCTCAGGSTCVLSANNECSGTCVTGAPCARIVTKDDSGQEKVSCSCGGSPAVTPAGVVTRQPGFFDGIASFFNKLFGGR